MSAFKGIKDKKAPINSEYFRAGKYLTYINSFKQIKNRNEEDRIVFELTIVAVLDESAAAKEPQGPHTVGSKVGWISNPKKDAALPAVKAALMAITGVQEDSIDQAFCDGLSSEAQPLKGMYVEWSNQVIATKAGAPFTVVRAKRRWNAEEVKQAVPQNLLDSLKIDTSAA